MGIRGNSSKQSDEPGTKLNRLRSIKVTNLDRFRLSMRRSKSRLSQGIVLQDDSLDKALQSKESPNYMKPTTCFNARKGSSLPNAGLKRMYSLKRMRKLPNQSSGNRRDQDSTIDVAPPKLKLIRSGSIKIARVRSIKLSRRRWSRSQLHQPSVFMTDDEELSSEDLMSDLLTIYTESTSSFKVTQKSMKSSVSAVGKPTRTLWKMPSLRSKRRTVNKFDRATCSSALKSTKVAKPHHIAGECESDSQLIGHVCPYTYCSLHGHLHAPSPPLKGFISTKRRLLKKQRSIRLKRKPVTEARDLSRMKPSMQVHEDPMSENQIDNPHDAQGRNEEIFVQIYEPKPIKTDVLHKQSAETDILIDDKKYSNMWRLIYKHLPVPGTDASNEEGDTGKNMDANTMDTEGSHCNLNQDQQDENQDMNLDNQAVDKEKLEFSQTEAIEFVQRAVDEILHLDEQSPLYPISPNTVLNLNDVGVCRNEEPPADPAEEDPNGAILIKKEVPSEGNQPRSQRSKGFEKLRKMIITAKFIKAVEKLRRINPQKPRYLSAEAKSQQEKILLRHLSIDGRKSTEEWMLDFALQQVIAKLAPHQRRRVTVLVEAFENIKSDPSKLPPSNYMAPTANVLEEERFIPLDLNSSGLCDNASAATVNAEDHIHSRVIDSGAKLVLEVDDKQSIIQQVDETTEDKVLEKPMKTNEETVSSPQDPFQDPASDPTVNIHYEETNFSFDKEKFTNVWHNVYRQFIANEETMSIEKIVDGKEQEVGNASSYNECSDTILGQIDVKDEVKQADAIQLVQEAIDELLLLHEQLSDQRPSKSDKKEGHLCSLEPTDHSLILKDTQIRESEKTDTADQKALPRQTSKPLSKLKKLVLSAKFIKTMEKLRKIRTCKTENSSSQVSGRPVAEKVCLRHLSMDERRDSEEWMLDNALQHVISKLAPAQQRRVALLTQAFETITPEFEQMHTKYSRLKMQPDDYTASSLKQKNEKDNLVVVDHDTPLIHDNNPQHSEDLIPEDASVVSATTIQQEGCPPCCPDNIQAEYKNGTGFKTKHHDEQNLIDSHKDEHKVNVQTYVLGERKYSKMWQLIYQHVKSNSSAECENQTTETRAIDDQPDDAAGKKLEITQSDAIKMVQEAVDGILQQCNSSEELSINVSLDQNSPDGDYDVKGATVVSTEKNDQGSKSAQIAFQGNSKWKKAILCSKFVKAMEKMQKLYAQKKRCHHNPLISDQEAEVVHLRQSLMDERSNSEAWMLDYALRQVIAKLAPVQQLKVAMLIEAFETVGPDTEETSKESRCKTSRPSDIVFTAGSEGVKEEMSFESCQDLEPTGSSNIYNEKAEETKSSGESSQSQDIGKDTNNDGGNNIFLDGQKYSSMWRLIYKHIKSGLPNTDADVEQIPTKTDMYGPANDEETPCDSLQSSTDNENADQNLDSTNTEQQKDAIKLVEEAVNEILHMEVQSCDEQAMDSDEKTREANKAHQELPRSYSVLSKVILCKKFIKAMEKMKKSNPKDDRFLLQQSDLPAENVHLKTQKIDEKNCEEWMLDYALQQVVGKLAPTQKKKVSMLVEAFERVNPLPDTRKHQRLNPVAR